MSPEIPLFSLEFGRDHEAVVVKVSGEVDLASTPAIRDALDELIVNQGNLSLRIDLAEVTFMDSTGLNLLVGTLKVLRDRGGSMTIANPTATIRRLFDLTGLSTVFSITRRGEGSAARSGDGSGLNGHVPLPMT